MKRMHAILSTVALLVSITTTAFAEVKPEQMAEAAAEKWLSGIDAGKFAESWQEGAALLKGAVTEEVWKMKLEGVRKPLGKLISRVLKSATHLKTLPGAPDGDYVVLQFTAVFENKKEAVETVTPMMEADGSWKVSGYFIR